MFPITEKALKSLRKFKDEGTDYVQASK